MRYALTIPVMLLLLPLASGYGSEEDNLFKTDTMVMTNTGKMEKDPNRGTGRLFQLGGSISINSGMRCGNRGTLSDQPFSFTTDLIAYMDSRINSHLRGYASLLYRYSRADATNSTALNEAFVDFDIRNKVFFRIGKQRFKTGLGVRWRVTDWINSETGDALDTAYADSLRTGVTGIRVRAGGSALFLKLPENEDMLGTRLFLKQDIRIGSAELSLTFSAAKDSAPVYGAGFAFGAFGLDWHVEAALSGEAARDRVKLVDPGSRVADPLANIIIYREEKILPQIVFGGSYNNQSRRISFSFEYFYNGAGYDDASLYPYAFLADTAVPDYLGRHYAAASIGKSEIISLTDSAGMTLVANLSDTSFSLYPVYSMKINDNLNLSLSLIWRFGNKNGEYTFPRAASDGSPPFSIVNPMSMEVAYGSERDVLALNLRMELGL